jgi:hypothetical protein
VTDESRAVKYSSGQGTVDEAAKAFSYDLASRTAHLAAGLDLSLQAYLHPCISTQALCEEYTYLGLFLFFGGVGLAQSKATANPILTEYVGNARGDRAERRDRGRASFSSSGTYSQHRSLLGSAYHIQYGTPSAGYKFQEVCRNFERMYARFAGRNEKIICHWNLFHTQHDATAGEWRQTTLPQAFLQCSCN